MRAAADARRSPTRQWTRHRRGPTRRAATHSRRRKPGHPHQTDLRCQKPLRTCRVDGCRCRC